MDREELARQFALADFNNGDSPLINPPSAWAADIVGRVDALLSALAPAAAVAPVAPTAAVEPAKPKPVSALRVGDVARTCGGYEFVLVDFTENVEIRKAWILNQPGFSNQKAPRMDSWGAYWPGPVTFVRPATPSERAAAGLPAPEAKRPEWVRITGPANPWSVTAGKVYEVTEWDKDGCPAILNDNGSVWWLPDASDRDFASTWPSWEPAPCPPPVAAKAGGEDAGKYAALVAAARRAVGRVDALGSVSSLEELREVLGDLGIHIARPASKE